MATKTQPAQTIHVVIKDKNGLIMEEDVPALTSYNETGVFDVLPLHTNFISLIKKKLTIHKKPEKKEIVIGVGLIKVENDLVQIYLGLPETLEEAQKPIVKKG